MSATMTDTDGVVTQTPLESRAETSNLDALQAKRRAIVKQLAPLAAKFKGGTTAGSDSARKRHRALVAKRILLTQFADKSAPSEAALERMANADVEHIAFCEKLEADFTRFIILENDRDDITEQIRSREEELRCYRAELGLQ